MDFGTLLHMAKKNNEGTKNESKFYSTKFAPPKKETKEKRLSENIQKFLQKREQEEKERKLEEKRKLANLLAMRDEKSKNKIKKMLKVTKSANKSVLDDAVNTEHTAVTMNGPDQPDQDDYGYVSTEANAFYQKYIEKVKDVKEDKGFAPCRPQSIKDLSGTKERVKAAITRENEEKRNGRQRSSTITSGSSSSSAGGSGSSSREPNSSIVRAYSTSKALYDPEAERQAEVIKKQEEKAKHRKPLPPPMDFQALLKLAEKKQYEPVEALVEVKKKKEPERLLTLKEKKELEERQRAKEARERRDREREREHVRDMAKDRKDSGGTRVESNARASKSNAKPSSNATTVGNTASAKSSSAAVVGRNTAGNQNSPSINAKKPTSSTAPSTAVSSKTSTQIHATQNRGKSAPNPRSLTSTQPGGRSSATTSAPPVKSTASSSALTNSATLSSRDQNKKLYTGATREFPPRDMKPTRPSDIRRGPSGSQIRPGEGKKPQAVKRRIVDDDDEDEDYDSELDDFIDDGDCEEDYSSHIKAIFGYDKSKYRDADDDDTAMESNFAQVQREEYISKKIGLQEDLEDMRIEAVEKEKKRKLIQKKRKLHG